MVEFKTNKQINAKSQSGQALIMALLSLLVLGIVAGLVITQSTGLNNRAVDQEKNESLMRVQRTLETILSNNLTCLGTGTGLRGLQFVNAGAEANNLLQGATLIARPVGVPIPAQDVSVEILQRNVVGGAKIIARGNDGVGPAAVLPDFNLTIDRLYITNVSQRPPAGSNKFDADFYLDATVAGNKFAPRNLGRMFIQVDAANVLTSCSITPSAQLACQQMNCTWNSTSAPGKNKCVCGFPAVSCPAVAGQPRQYLSGVDTSTMPPTPICSNFLVSCKNAPYGPGFFLTGVDINGNPICQPLEDYVTPSCTGGATTIATANLAAPAGCYCPVGQTWDGTSCGGPLVCAGGSTTTPSGVPAAPAGCFCLATESWNGTNCVAIVNGLCGPANGTTVASAPAAGLCSAGTATAVAGSGPWTWSCNGSGGGSNASCSANSSAPPPPVSTWTIVGGCTNPYPRICFSNTFVRTGTLSGIPTCSVPSITALGYTILVTGWVNSFAGTVVSSTPCTTGQQGYWLKPVIPDPADPNCINDYLALQCN
jgi:hypothetical protein